MKNVDNLKKPLYSNTELFETHLFSKRMSMIYYKTAVK